MSIQEWFSLIGNLSQFLLVLLGLFVFVQIKVAKDAFKTQCERDALTKSADLAHYFAQDIIPKIDDYYRGLKVEGFASTPLELSSFCRDDIKLLSKDQQEKCQKDFNFYSKNKLLRAKCIYVFNDFEALAINFTKLIADEKVLFTALSQSYCGFIEKNYAILCLIRKTKHDLYYVNTIDLYKEWSKKIKLNGLLVEKRGVDEKVAEMNKECYNRYTPKGV